MLVSRFVRNLITFLGLTLIFACGISLIKEYYQNEIDMIKIKKEMCKSEIGVTPGFRDSINIKMKELKEKRKILGWFIPSEVDTIKEVKCTQ